jgi:hypothetical protein
VIKDLVADAERLEIMEQAAFLVAQCVFTDNILKDIDEYKTLLTKVNRHFFLLFIRLLLLLFILVMFQKCKRTKVFITCHRSIGW